MGRSMSADIAYGVELASYDGYHFSDTNVGYYSDVLEALELEEGVDSDLAEDLLLMFLGHDNPVDMGYAERGAALKTSRLEIDRGGYEYSSVVVKVRDVGAHYYGWVNQFEIPEDGPSVQDASELVRFIEWLDAKNLRLEDGVRTPGWLLMTSYG